MNCPAHTTDPVEALAGQVLCYDCDHRLWQELHWLADIYDPMFAALTRRLNVERVEQVKVSGGADPLAVGMNLNDDAIEVRAKIRSLALSGLSWAASNMMIDPGDWDVVPVLPSTYDVPGMLRWLARHLKLITSDISQAYQVRHYGSEVVKARVHAESLLTPAPLRRKYWFMVETVGCWTNVGDEDNPETCKGQLGVWIVDGNMLSRELVCGRNPGHVHTFKEAQTESIRRMREGARQAELIRAIVGGGGRS